MISSLNKLLLKRTKPMLRAYLPYLKKNKMAFIGTKYEKSNMLQSLCSKHSYYYANMRWLEGFLTNHNVLKNIVNNVNILHRKYFFNLRLRAFLRALITLPEQPKMAFITNTSEQTHIIHEMYIKNIPTIFVVDFFRFTSHNVDVRLTSYPILGSEHSVHSALLLMYLFKQMKSLMFKCSKKEDLKTKENLPKKNKNLLLKENKQPLSTKKK